MIDWDRVANLRDEVGEDDFAMIVDLFQEEVDEVIARLRADPSLARIEEDLHFLRGSALNLGFRALGRLCHEGERMAAEGRLAEFDREALFEAYEASWAMFRAGKAGLQPPV